jgi:hypothetical protein
VRLRAVRRVGNASLATRRLGTLQRRGLSRARRVALDFEAEVIAAALPGTGMGFQQTSETAAPGLDPVATLDRPHLISTRPQTCAAPGPRRPPARGTA